MKLKHIARSKIDRFTFPIEIHIEDLQIKKKVRVIRLKCKLCRGHAKKDRDICQRCIDEKYHNKKEN